LCAFLEGASQIHLHWKPQRIGAVVLQPVFPIALVVAIVVFVVRLRLAIHHALLHACATAGTVAVVIAIAIIAAIAAIAVVVTPGVRIIYSCRLQPHGAGPAGGGRRQRPCCGVLGWGSGGKLGLLGAAGLPVAE
jgi:hypothetical protein